MWSHIAILVYITIPWANTQRGRSVRQFYNSHGWDIRLAVPGEPGNDYPVLNTIPRTSFSCAKKAPGYYADVEANCQVFRVCTLGSTFSFQSFLCPNGTLFNQAVFVCDWWMNVNCKKSEQYFNNNEKHGNLRIGPQLMVDVKNMLTHSMRNPYDKVVIKNNLIMQEYIPPSGQLQVNSGYFGNFEQNLDKYYIYEKQSNNIPRQNAPNLIDTFTASTTSPQYIPSFNPLRKNKFENYQIPNSLHKSHQGNSVLNVNTKQAQFNTQRNYNELRNNNEMSLRSTQEYKQNYNTNIAQAYSQLGKQIQENSVSIDVPSTVITKTLTYRRLIPNPKQGQPKSRITFKTWIVKPSRSARLTAEPTPYTYNIPSTTLENIVAENSYFYNKPTTVLITTNSDTPTENISPTISYSPISRNEQQLLITAPTKSTPTVPNRSYLNPVSTAPQKPALLYLPPTTYKPASLLYIPSDENAKLSLQTNVVPSTQITKLNYEISKSENPLYSLTKQSRINAKHKNLTFSDILTKEKLDITVDDIVKNTNAIIEAEAAKQTNNIKQDIKLSKNYYLPPESDSRSGEYLTSEPPLELPKSSRLIVSPSINLEPPLELSDEPKQPVSQFAKLPFIKESVLPSNTIERTVSLKITIPEKIADLLFKNKSVAQSDNLELLNTGSSNYILLNQKEADNTGNNLIPIVKLTWNDNENLSNSQDLVLSFLADSISSAKQYTNAVKQEYLTSNSKSTTNTKPKPSQNYDGTELEQLTSRISDLTSSQYSKNNNILSRIKQSNSDSKQTQTKTFISNNRQKESIQPKQERLIQAQQNKNLNEANENFQINSNQIYSGQLYKLPVPVVTQQIYNAPSTKTYLNKEYKTVNNKVSSQNEQLNLSVGANKQKIFQNPSRNDVFQQASLNNENELTENIQGSETKISAHIQDKTIGTIQHPLEDNKIISYKNDKSYLVYSNLNDEIIENNIFQENNGNSIRIKKLPLNDDLSDLITYQLLPSISYKLENEEQKQNILNAFELNEQGRPEQTINIIDQDTNQRQTNTDSDDQNKIFTETQQYNNLNTLYNGPSSYLAPQKSIGNLETPQTQQSESLNTEIEDLNSNENFNGYAKITPSKRFLF